MEKNIKKITNLINDTIKNTNRLSEQFNFLNKLNYTFLQKGAAEGSNLNDKIILKNSYNALLSNINFIIDYYLKNKIDYSNLESKINSDIEKFTSSHPFQGYPDNITLDQIVSLTSIINSLKENLKSEKFTQFYENYTSNSNDELIKETQDNIINQTNILIPLSQVKNTSSKLNTSKIKEGILYNLTNFQKVQIYGMLMDAIIQKELKKYEKLNKNLNTNINKLSEKYKKFEEIKKNL